MCVWFKICGGLNHIIVFNPFPIVIHLHLFLAAIEWIGFHVKALTPLFIWVQCGILYEHEEKEKRRAVVFKWKSIYRLFTFSHRPQTEPTKVEKKMCTHRFRAIMVSLLITMLTEDARTLIVSPILCFYTIFFYFVRLKWISKSTWKPEEHTKSSE